MEFVKLKDLCEFEKGSTGLAKAEPGDYPLVTTGAERKTSNIYQFDAKAVCIPLVSSTGHGHASLKNVHYQEGKFALGSILVALTSKDENRLNIQFLHLYLSQLKDQVLVPLMSGAANVALSIKKVQDIVIPLPSIERQHEIVERFKSIVIEEAELKAELTHQQTLLKKLRQQILQEAIEGKLTADWRSQNPDVEPASELLKRIATEKAQLVKDKKIKAQKPLPPITDEEKPFELPKGWLFTRFEICSINKDELRIPITKADRNAKQKIYDYYGASGVIDKIDGFTHQGRHLLVGEDGANLLARSTPIAFLADGKFWVNNHAHVIATIDSITLDYLAIHINAINLKPYISGGFQPKLSQANLNRIVIAVPPLMEQQAIVTKVENLLAICDQLETQITQNQTHAEQLMQSVLKEAFNPNSESTG
ncbi:restriction endonuclease subunit S [Laspinema sp. D1]|uniref:Restriction endonuclease subunit S n=1 Tax=Laspinema palackyanum D2a TaxID=2953684 RepID=A0ABT2MN47_9CYAN|nr:restriction endonuclease subunit S [Laspinema sp. D2a]